MNWISKMERKYGKYEIRNITLYLIVCYAFGYVIQLMNPGFLAYLTLDPHKICQGQVWRLFTWIVIPPGGLDIFTLIMLYFYYSIGRTMEQVWGTFRYNVYLISGMLFTIVGAFLLYAGTLLTGLNEAATVAQMNMTLDSFYSIISMSFSTYYVCMSIMLAYAMTFPEARITLLVMFVIPLPIKVKVLGIIYSIILAVDFLSNLVSAVTVRGTVIGYYYVANCIAILFSLMSTIIFFVTTRKSFRTPKQIKRQHEFKKQTVKIQKIAKHKCAICGRTSEENPDMDFRFCSKCDGNYSYCSEHIFTHTHVKK